MNFAVILEIVTWIIVLGAFVLLSGFIATVIGLTGGMWRIVAIVCFIFLIAFASFLGR